MHFSTNAHYQDSFSGMNTNDPAFLVFLHSFVQVHPKAKEAEDRDEDLRQGIVAK